ncbi:response regulator [Coralloluteibacterium stylophorae]|uniref:Response regulator n=1 Tax=Coralloluteibacterium stylophorae TaxID=1776034 RepID=A0A8J7VVI0_9GAMM|nr:response regulator [Coralloluteibacterium stylophorae]MBS7456284.1 response regulator [Coralloluteibacterium stylophorae]
MSDRPRRILLVEDEPLVAMLEQEMLTEAGYEVVGPFSRLARAREAARSEAIDAATLDVNLFGEFVYPVAEILAVRGIPFAFLSGYGADAGGAFPDAPVLSKPFGSELLLQTIQGMLRQRMASG